MPNDPVYYLHIPKTGGTSLTSFLDNQFDVGDVCPAQLLPELFSLHLESMDRYRLFRGHLWYGLGEYIGRRLNYITMLRDPVQRTVSWYMHVLRDPGAYRHQQMNDEGWSLLDFVRDPQTNWDLVNTQTLFLAVDLDYGRLSRDPVGYGRAVVKEYAARRHDRELLDLAKRRLESFAFLGITERMRDSMALLAHVLGFYPNFSIPRLNTSPGQQRTHRLSGAELDAINELNPLDNELYAWACQLFDERLGDMLRSLLTEHYERSAVFVKKSWHVPVVEQAKSQVEVTMLGIPSEVAVKETFYVSVCLANRSRYQISSRAPNPVHVSYHWFDAEESQVVVFDGARTKLQASLMPNEEREMRAIVTAPHDAGRYVLRMTLVQEGVSWFDDGNSSAFCEAGVVVSEIRLSDV